MAVLRRESPIQSCFWMCNSVELCRQMWLKRVRQAIGNIGLRAVLTSPSLHLAVGTSVSKGVTLKKSSQTLSIGRRIMCNTGWFYHVFITFCDKGIVGSTH